MPTIETFTRILIIDDDEDDFFLTADYIKSIPEFKCKIDWCFNYNNAVAAIQQQGYDIYFVDYRLGAKTGIDLLQEARSMQCEEPIVLLTGKGNKTVDMEAMRIGATDYLIKGELTSEKIERCIRYSLERSATLKALKASESKYRSIFEQSKDAVFTTTPDLFFLDINTACAKLFGYSPAEMSTISLYDLMTPRAKEYTRQVLEYTGELMDYETELMTKTQDTKYCILTAVMQNSGSPTAYVQGIIHDITNLKKAEKANLQMEKLAAAGRLVRTLAHEVRNPLNNINMSVEQLKNGSDVEEAGMYMDIINRNSDRISGLITELLSSSKPTEMIFEKSLLQSILDNTLTDAFDRITLKQINVSLNYDSRPAWSMVDSEKLKIALLNIIINAIEAMESHRGMLTIAASHGKYSHTITISDNGSGIAQENINKLFEPYFTSKRNGMGLGLASTLNIIQSHSGAIDVISEPEKGTSFIITLPNADN